MHKENKTFDAEVELKRIRSLRAEARRKRFHKSRLEKYRAELVAMRLVGASCGDLAEWLRVKYRCRIHRSTIDRFLKKLPELNKSTFSDNNK